MSIKRFLYIFFKMKSLNIFLPYKLYICYNYALIIIDLYAYSINIRFSTYIFLCANNKLNIFFLPVNRNI